MFWMIMALIMAVGLWCAFPGENPGMMRLRAAVCGAMWAVLSVGEWLTENILNVVRVVVALALIPLVPFVAMMTGAVAGDLVRGLLGR